MSEVAKADPDAPERTFNPRNLDDITAPNSGLRANDPYPGKINRIREVTTPAAPLIEQVETYERLRHEMRERVRKQALVAKAELDLKYVALRAEFDQKVSDEIAKIEQSRQAAYRALYDAYERQKNENEALLLRLDE